VWGDAAPASRAPRHRGLRRCQHQAPLAVIAVRTRPQ
jgi:hypothetical protein